MLALNLDPPNSQLPGSWDCGLSHHISSSSSFTEVIYSLIHAINKSNALNNSTILLCTKIKKTYW
jgi:hypothetical protein